MKQQATFYVVRRDLDPLKSHGPKLQPAEFLDLLETCIRLGIANGYENVPPQRLRGFGIAGPPNSSEMQVALKKLEQFGWKVYNGYTPPELRKTHFMLNVRRWWDESDLDAAPLLRFCGWRAQEFCIAWFSGYRNGECVAVAKSVGAFGPVPWTEPFGYLDGGHHLLIRSEGKALLETQLVGCEFKKLLWDEPELVKAEYWDLGSVYTMPPGLTPVVVADDQWRYEDGVYDPPELAFSRTQVEQMGKFDIAWTQEVTGLIREDRPNYRGRALIVSQRFREVSRQLITAEDQVIGFEPVKLV